MNKTTKTTKQLGFFTAIIFAFAFSNLDYNDYSIKNNIFSYILFVVFIVLAILTILSRKHKNN